jgi:hypothetical protein
VILRPGAKLASPSRTGQTVRLRAVRPVEDADGGFEVEFEVQSGMGRGKTPEQGSVPVVGEERCYATFLAEQRGTRPELPDADQTPWTHGGPPWPFVPRAEEQAEDWR